MVRIAVIAALLNKQLMLLLLMLLLKKMKMMMMRVLTILMKNLIFVVAAAAVTDAVHDWRCVAKVGRSGPVDGAESGRGRSGRGGRRIGER